MFPRAFSCMFFHHLPCRNPAGRVPIQSDDCSLPRRLSGSAAGGVGHWDGLTAAWTC